MNNILSLDPALLKTGWSVLTTAGKLEAYGTIDTSFNMSDIQRLMYISENVSGLIEFYKVGKLIIEDVYYLKNIQTYCLLAQVSGVLKLTGYAKLGNNVFVLPTTFIRSVFGLKNKEEVFNFVVSKFNLTDFNFKEHNDICDSIIIGLCFLDDAVYKTKKLITVEKKLGVDMKTYLTEAHLTNLESLADIAKRLKVGYSTLHSWMRNLKIPIRESDLYPKVKIPPFVKI